MGEMLARWLRTLLALRRGRAVRLPTFAATDRLIERSDRELREIEARLDLLEWQARRQGGDDARR